MLLINVRTGNQQFSKVRDFAVSEKADIVALQEVNKEWMSQLDPLKEHFPHVVAEPREDNFGIALFSKFPLRNPRVEYFGEADVPSLVAHGLTPGGEVLIVTTHPLPPVGTERFQLRNQQLRRVADYIKAGLRPAILLGDLNVSPWSYHFRRLLRESRLVDTSRGHGFQPTWPTMLPPLGADHYPLTVRLGIPRGDEM
jgi:endonuclease/exonuclease/phosphatase (EEP) superfamily protein YafD